MIDFMALQVPEPTPTMLSVCFWDAVREGRLLLQQCAECATEVFYPRALCPRCWCQRLTWREVSGLGTLKSYSVVQMPGHPGWLPAVPYAVGLIALNEGPTMISLVVADVRCLAVGESVEFRPVLVGKWKLPNFEPCAANRDELHQGG